MGPVFWGPQPGRSQGSPNHHLKRLIMKKQKTKNTLFGLWGQLMVVELVPVGGRLGRRILAEKRPGEVFFWGGGCSESRSLSATSF